MDNTIPAGTMPIDRVLNLEVGKGSFQKGGWPSNQAKKKKIKPGSVLLQGFLKIPAAVRVPWWLNQLSV